MKNYGKEDIKYMNMEEYEMKKDYKEMPYQDQHMCHPHGYHHGHHCGCVPMPQPKCKVVHKYHYEDYPVCVPVHTHYVNHIVKKPKFIPRYSCSEEVQCDIQRPC
ncbi:hypothetical protein RI065_07285 [Mycoplasmatota bacterium zrk1]